MRMLESIIAPCSIPSFVVVFQCTIECCTGLIMLYSSTIAFSVQGYICCGERMIWLRLKLLCGIASQVHVGRVPQRART